MKVGVIKPNFPWITQTLPLPAALLQIAHTEAFFLRIASMPILLDHMLIILYFRIFIDLQLSVFGDNSII